MKLTSIIEGVGLGALLMYLFDPDRGNSRRAVIRDQAAAQLRRKRQAIDVMTRDLANRSQGWKHMARQRLNREPVADDVLCERIRAELGRHVTHPGSIEITAENGHVTLKGPILAHEAQELVRMVKMMPGVKSVDNNLDVHQSAEHVPGLQGQGSLPGSQFANRWTPATCLLGGAAGLVLAVYGTGRRGISGTLLQLLGAGMVAKAFNDTEHRFEPIQRNGESRGSGSRRGEEPQGTAMEIDSADVANSSATVY